MYIFFCKNYNDNNNKTNKPKRRFAVFLFFAKIQTISIVRANKQMRLSLRRLKVATAELHRLITRKAALDIER